MDEVLEKLGSTLIGQDSNESKTNFDGLYKNWGKLDNQEERRRNMLRCQKGNRNSTMDQFRGIVELVQAVQKSNIFQEEKILYQPKIFVAGFTRMAYNNVLMLSEWLVEKPDDFDDMWYVVPCPKAVRTLVVASYGRTRCFSKYGHLRLECPTALPGGNQCQLHYNSRCCILDCFYVEALKTMYILDILAWNSQTMTDGETEFRHYWIKTEVNEISELKTLSKKNKLIFKILPKVPCDPESLNQFMMTFPHFPNHFPKLDGLLFYHKHAHYIAGETPLVGWLYPFMVPEVLGPEVTVNPAYMLEKPLNYQGQADFIKKFEKRASYSTRRSRRESEAMEAENFNYLYDTEPMEADASKPAPAMAVPQTPQEKSEEKIEKME